MKGSVWRSLSSQTGVASERNVKEKKEIWLLHYCLDQPWSGITSLNHKVLCVDIFLANTDTHKINVVIKITIKLEFWSMCIHVYCSGGWKLILFHRPKHRDRLKWLNEIWIVWSGYVFKAGVSISIHPGAARGSISRKKFFKYSKEISTTDPIFSIFNEINSESTSLLLLPS